MLANVMQELRRQRWDDHRFYHQSRINQTLHLISAISFLFAYVLVFKNPLAAVLVGWCIGMVTRQTGHYVFEPAHYDQINDISNERKETIKVGFNQKRKTILIAAVVGAPLVLSFDPTLFGAFTAHADLLQFANHVAVLWLVLAMIAIVSRCIQLCLTRSVLTGIVWVLKIATDPVHNIRIYWKSPYYLMKGQLYDPMHHLDSHDPDDEEDDVDAIVAAGR